MPKVRGILALNTMQYVKAAYGPEAHRRVIEALPPERRATFLGPIRDASWEPLEDVLAYMEAAKRLLAPDAAGFYRSMGSFSGRQSRTKGGFLPMIAEPETAYRMAAVIWRSFYDSGRVEVALQGSSEALVRVHDFPASRIHCERMCGAWEALLTTPRNRVRVNEVACGADGGAYCEFRISWEAPAF